MGGVSDQVDDELRVSCASRPTDVTFNKQSFATRSKFVLFAAGLSVFLIVIPGKLGWGLRRRNCYDMLDVGQM